MHLCGTRLCGRRSILGYATLLREDALEAGRGAAAADLDRILRAGRHLLTAVNDMLGLSRVDSGEATLERQVIDIRRLADTLASSEQADLQARLEVEIDEETSILIGDAAKLRQCLLTLLTVATQSAASDPVKLEIAPEENEEIPSLSFSISAAGDCANGRPNGSHDEPSSALLGEAGLGVALARRLAALMGGECLVAGSPATGLSFRLTLPLSPHREDDSGPPRVERLKADAAGGNNTPRCALVVDDDEAALDLMQRWLVEIGYEVIIAHEGETGLRLARDKRPDVILLDGLLPGRSGYDILAELRADPLLDRTPVIFVTVDDDRNRGIGCGASDYVRKPLTQANLRAILEIYAGGCKGEVLIIDDDDDAAELIRRGIEEVGFSSRRAHDGVEGLDMARANPPAAIVLDVHMPQLDGFGVIEQLSRASDLSRIPIVVVSGHEMDLAEHRRLAAVAHRVLTKGIAAPRDIAQSVREAVG
jgi:CheY-like chemotaxis protein